MAIFLTTMAAVVSLAVTDAPTPETSAETRQRPENRMQETVERLDCSLVVRRVVRETGGRLLSVRVQGGQCVVNILVQRENSRPRKIVVRADPKKEGAGKSAALAVEPQTVVP